MIQEKAKSLYDNLKQKEGEGSKTGEFNESVEWSDHFIKWFGFKNVKMAEEVASAHQEAADEFPDTIKKITKLMIKTTFIYKATNSWVFFFFLTPGSWKKKINTRCQSFGCTIRSPEQWDQIFWIYSLILCPWI